MRLMAVDSCELTSVTSTSIRISSEQWISTTRTVRICTWRRGSSSLTVLYRWNCGRLALTPLY